MLNVNTVIKGEIGSDDFELFYKKDINEFLDELERRELNTIRPAIDTKAIEFLTLDDLNKKGYQVKSLSYLQNRIFLKVQDMVYPVAENAFISIKSRIDIYGKGLLELPDDLLRDVLNIRIKEISEIRVIIIDDKVRAIMSAANGGYVVMPTKEVVENVLDALESKFEEIEFKNAHLTYDMLYLKILFPEKAEVIQDLYGKALEYIPGIMLRTSDTGYAANEVFPIWDVKGGSIVFGDVNESIRMVHRGKSASIENLKDDLPNIFVKLRDTIGCIRKQMEYKIKYPALTIENACKKFNLGKKDTRQMLERYELFAFKNPNVELNGYHITQLFIDMAREETDENKKRSLETIAGKAFNLRYEKLDEELD
jgi:hypothetical protein